jgi:hypothetical protein
MSDAMAAVLVEAGVEVNRDTAKMVSILFPTGIEFLIIWITLMRMGYGVVLIACVQYQHLSQPTVPAYDLDLNALLQPFLTFTRPLHQYEQYITPNMPASPRTHVAWTRQFNSSRCPRVPNPQAPQIPTSLAWMT